tara:strand:- start:156 stop:380 length:225 start_codon:yes stop_codon:yes gene_type:complete
METELIHTMKTATLEESHKFIMNMHKKNSAFNRDRFVHLVQCHTLNTGTVPHFEAVLKKIDLTILHKKANTLKF